MNARCVCRFLCIPVRALPELILCALTATPCAAVQPLLLFNGNVWTADDRSTRAEAVVAVDGRVVFIGTSVKALRRAPPGPRCIDCTVLPGLTAAHAHLAEIGFRELSFNLEGTASLAELKSRLRQQASQGKSGEWITGRGWIEARWTPATFPTRLDLDEVVSDRPVSLERPDGHAMVVNSLVLRLAGIDRNTADPAGGRILKGTKGEPTGILIDNAMDLVLPLVP